MNDCLFCKIIAGEIPSAKVYEDEYVYAFRDILPRKIPPALLRFLKLSLKLPPQKA